MGHCGDWRTSQCTEVSSTSGAKRGCSGLPEQILLPMHKPAWTAITSFRGKGPDSASPAAKWHLRAIALLGCVETLALARSYLRPMDASHGTRRASRSVSATEPCMGHTTSTGWCRRRPGLACSAAPWQGKRPSIWLSHAGMGAGGSASVDGWSLKTCGVSQRNGMVWLHCGRTANRSRLRSRRVARTL